jgi:DNA mismatch repair protein MutS
VANVHVAALERNGRVVFLYAVRPGPADRAYGIQVARLAGLPPWVADRADALLADLVRQRAAPASAAPGIDCEPDAPPDPHSEPRRVSDADGLYQLSLAGAPAPAPTAADLLRALRDRDLGTMTPRAALDWLWTQQERFGGPGRSRG